MHTNIKMSCVFNFTSCKGWIWLGQSILIAVLRVLGEESKKFFALANMDLERAKNSNCRKS